MESQREKAIRMDAECYKKAVERGQQTFTLVVQDISAPTIICEWIKQNIDHAPAEKLLDALEDAIAMREYPHRKFPD